MDFFDSIDIDDKFLKDLFKILKINTIKSPSIYDNPFGRAIKIGLDSILDICESYGFKTTNLDNYIGYAEYINEDSKEYVGVLGHIDVVPVGDGWNTEPFNPVIKEGKLYARGALDDKGPLFAALYALKLLKDSGIKLSKNVRIIFGTNEESGTEDIDYYLQREEAPILCFTPDSYFPIVTSEKGILTFELAHKMYSSNEYKIEYIKGGKKSNIVPDICEIKLAFKDIRFLNNFNNVDLNMKYNIELQSNKDSILIRAFGKSAHASTPEEGDNAICKMMEYLYKSLNFNDSFTTFLKNFNNLIGRDYYGENLEINFEDEESGKLTMNLGIISGNSEEIKMRFNVRYPVTIDFKKVVKNIEEKVSLSTLSFIMGNHNYPLHFQKDHILIKGLKKAYEETFKREAKLLSSGGGTYAKLMPNTVAFGPLNEGDPDLAHQKNEYIEINQLKKCVEAYARAIYELAK
ncbi:dipeptidase PepV [Clostridium sp.]|uniref:dipeptidase PepV n=1 Tax=Clostridium sp. TaxID=1506 RepID=UPI0029076703|nr:dipeptidase PepV [Clostridium sp.]MDU5106982.1 dipeptidase PepV [Clostridium sp.]